jgi:opacity protein-like surface antigen
MVSVGYDFFALNQTLHKSGQKFYVFGQYDFYDSMYKTEKSVIKSDWCRKNRYTVGVNYYPMKEIVIKAEYSYRKYPKPYNSEPTIAVGIGYSGLFL